MRCHWHCGIVMVTTVQYLTKNCVSQFEAEAGQKRYDGIVGSTLRSGELLPGGARPLGYRGACYAFLVWSLHTRLVLGSPAPRNDDEHLALMKGGWDCFLLPVMPRFHKVHPQSTEHVEGRDDVASSSSVFIPGDARHHSVENFVFHAHSDVRRLREPSLPEATRTDIEQWLGDFDKLGLAWGTVTHRSDGARRSS